MLPWCCVYLSRWAWNEYSEVKGYVEFCPLFLKNFKKHQLLASALMTRPVG